MISQLALAAMVSLAADGGTDAGIERTVWFSGGGFKDAKFTRADLEKIGTQTVSYTNEKSETHSYTGVPVLKVLKSLGYAGGECELMTVVGFSGAESTWQVLPSAKTMGSGETSSTAVDPMVTWLVDGKSLSDREGPFAVTLVRDGKGGVGMTRVASIEFPQLPAETRVMNVIEGTYRRSGFYSPYDWVRIVKKGKDYSITTWTSGTDDDTIKTDSDWHTLVQRDGNLLWAPYIEGGEGDDRVRVDLRIIVRGNALSILTKKVIGEPMGDWSTIANGLLPVQCPYLRVRE